MKLQDQNFIQNSRKTETVEKMWLPQFETKLVDEKMPCMKPRHWYNHDTGR